MSNNFCKQTFAPIVSKSLFKVKNNYDLLQSMRVNYILCVFHLHDKEKKEEIWLSPVTKTPTPTEQSKKQRDNIKRHQKLWLHNYCGPT